MGLIQQQSIKYSIISLVGIVIGFLSNIFIYPHDRAFYGVLNFIQSSANLLFPFLSLGAYALVIRFFPEFRSEKKGHHGLLGLVCLVALAGAGIWLLVYPFIRPYLLQFASYLSFDINTLANYEIYIFLLAVVLLFSLIFSNYASVFGRIAVPRLLTDFSIKLLFPALVFFSYQAWFNQKTLLNGMLLFYSSIVVLLALYIIQLGQFNIIPDFKFITSSRFRAMRAYALYGILSALGSMMAQRLDNIMVTLLVSEESNGTYSIFANMANTIQFPLLALVGIGGPIIAEKIKSGDWEGVKTLYQKTSLNGLIASIFLFLGVGCNLDDLLKLTGNYEALAPFKLIFFCLGFAKLIDMATSLNTQIILYSPYYRFDLLPLIFLAIVNIINNYLFIHILGYGVTGAAIATLLSIFLYNLIKLIFIQWKFKLQPFTRATLWLILIGVVTYGIGYIFQPNLGAIPNILLRSIILTIIYVSLVLYFRISDEFKVVVSNYWEKVKAYFH